MRTSILAAATLAAALTVPLASAQAATKTWPGPIADLITKLISLDVQRGVTVRSIREHLGAFQAIANANGGTRAANTPGYAASVDYVKRRLQRAGYQVTVQPVPFPALTENGPSKLERVAPTAHTYVNGTDFETMDFSAGGTVTARVVPVRNIVVPATPEPSSAAGCSPEDYPPEIAGAIALVQRGFCPFVTKAQRAKAAGAVGLILFNEGNPGRTDLFGRVPTEPGAFPSLSATYAVGAELYTLAQAGPVQATITVDGTLKFVDTWNVIADTRFGNRDRVVVVGGHLDSVPEGPGINDNGSGSATILAIAEQIGRRQVLLRNRVRFAFWAAEEQGLFGSTHYVKSLSEADRAKILLNLNFDMLGSPNYVRFVYDGNGSDTPDAGPNGSGLIENVFLAHFAERNLATAPTAFDGRSDYGPFIEVGIPAGGLFSGAEDIKTAAEARIYGGTAGQPYDACYHEACDTIANISDRALDQFSDAAADAVVVFGMRRDPVEDTVGLMAAKRATSAGQGPLYKGAMLQR